MAENVLHFIQLALKAPKDLFNDFGKYHYRSCESIIEGLKPILRDTGATVILQDEIVQVGTRTYVRSTASLLSGGEDGEEFIKVASASGWAREPESKKGMDESQITGSASSYARKQALSALFLLDDNKDADYLREGDEPKTPKRTDYVVDQRSQDDSTNGTKKGTIDEGHLGGATIPGNQTPAAGPQSEDPAEEFNRALGSTGDPRLYEVSATDDQHAKTFKTFMNARISEAGTGSNVSASEIDKFLMSFKTGPKNIAARRAGVVSKGTLQSVWTSYLATTVEK